MFVLGARPSYTEFFTAGALQSARMIDEGVFGMLAKRTGYYDVYSACLPYMAKNDQGGWFISNGWDLRRHMRPYAHPAGLSSYVPMCELLLAPGSRILHAAWCNQRGGWDSCLAKESPLP